MQYSIKRSVLCDCKSTQQNFMLYIIETYIFWVTSSDYKVSIWT